MLEFYLPSLKTRQGRESARTWQLLRAEKMMSASRFNEIKINEKREKYWLGSSELKIRVRLLS